MMMFWARRRPELWVRIVRIVAIVGSAVGVAVGAELLRRKAGVGVPRLSMTRNSRTGRLHVSLRTSKGGGRRGRAAVSASRS